MALLGKTVSYEVQGLDKTNWVISSMHKAKDEAVPAAEQLVDLNKYSAVRIIQDIQGEEKVIFQQDSAGQSDKPITISYVEQAPLCTKTSDLFQFNARQTTGRLLRKYLDDKGLITIELLCGLWHLKDLQRNETLLNQAFHRISSIQSRIKKTDAGKRFDFLEKSLGNLISQAQKLGDTAKFQTLLQGKGATALLDAFEGKPATSVDYLFLSVAAGLLGTKADWSNKLSLLLDLIDMDSSEQSLTRLDGIIAEFMDGPEASHEIIGPQTDLGSSILTSARLSTGHLKAGPNSNETEPLVRLNKILREFNLPLTRTVLLERANTGIRSIKPLTRENQTADKKAFAKIVTSLMSTTGFHGGAPICSALTQRARVLFEENGEDLTPEKAIETVLKFIPAPITQLGYLIDLGTTEFGSKQETLIIDTMTSIVSDLGKLKKSIMDKVPPNITAAAEKTLRNKLKNAFLETPAGQNIVNRIIDLLTDTVSTTAPQVVEVESVNITPQETSTDSGPLASSLKTIRVPAGEVIFREGEPGDTAYLVASGEVEILLESGSKSPRIALLSRGAIFGEMALIDQSPRMATARAVSNTVLTVVLEESFRTRLDKLSQSDRVMRKLLDVFVERLRAVSQ